MYKITETLISAAEKLGVQFFCGKPVRRINVNENRATGIMLEDGEEVTADVVIANADYPMYTGIYCLINGFETD